ncbi:MAG: ABC transporter ATP-binding protein [Planctomycetota bacterium]|jgi:ABC-2 type transport system ATP-binding protein
MNPIETRDLTVVYKTGILAKPVTGLDGLDLEVEPGTVFGYVGANGSGKTTTIKTILGLIRPTRGEALLFGKSSRLSESRREVGFLPEAPYFYEYLTGRETMDFYARLSGMHSRERAARTDEVLERVGLSGAAGRPVRTYSRGMRQRLGLAQAIVHRPKLAILDEPMSGLDPLGRRDVRSLIQELAREGTTVFFSSHILSDVEALCDRVGVLAEGKLVASGRVEELARARVTAVELRSSGITREDLAPLGEDVSSARRDGEVLTFEVTDDDAADRATRLVLERGGRVLSLVPVKESLEEVFTSFARCREAGRAGANQKVESRDRQSH